jgi:hypothetical protein
MPTREETKELVQAHAALDEPMETAIWIRREDREAWLVELLPGFSHDDHPERAIAFNPALTFRHPLNLVASNKEGLTRVDPILARDIAAGKILYGEEIGRQLQAVARTKYGDVQTG